MGKRKLLVSMSEDEYGSYKKYTDLMKGLVTLTEELKEENLHLKEANEDLKNSIEIKIVFSEKEKNREIISNIHIPYSRLIDYGGDLELGVIKPIIERQIRESTLLVQEYVNLKNKFYKIPRFLRWFFVKK